MRESCFEKIPSHHEPCRRLLQDVVSDWYPPLTPSDGFSLEESTAAAAHLGVNLPEALGEWFRMAGKRVDIWSKQDLLLAPGQWVLDDGYLVFYIENQDVTRWGIHTSDLGLDDPPVFVRSVDDAYRWIRQSSRVSEFTIHLFACCVAFSEPPRWTCGFPDAHLEEAILQTFPALDFPIWHWTTSRLYGFRDLLIEVQGHGYIHVSARTEEAFDIFLQLQQQGSFEAAAGWDH